MTKNKIKRCLSAILDPLPSAIEIDQIWDYFDSFCAYCNIELERANRDAHLDHVVPSSKGGSNSVYNHVLSCARCNGDTKREEPWQSFLEEVTRGMSAYVREQRASKIQTWLDNPANKKRWVSPEAKEVEQTVITRALLDFETAVKSLRKLKENEL